MNKMIDVVLLPTDKKINEVYLSINQIFIDNSDSKKYISTQNFFDKEVLSYFSPQHVYFLNKEEIMENNLKNFFGDLIEINYIREVLPF